MEPYFQTHHAVEAVYLLAMLIWASLEVRQFLRQRKWRQTADKVDSRAFALAFCTVVILAVAALSLSPHIAPAAEIGDGAIVSGVGMVLLITGIVLRAWSFHVLGQYFTFVVKVSSDQRVVSTGPYRLLRHPSYTGALLAEIGTGLLYGNWAGLAVLILLTLAMILWRIRVEEKALFTGLDNEYSAYAAGRKRIVPLLW
jgi:protein-S-isoprenylcysteine O-methyltransferase Ste14